jgi:hypothetical protein
MEENENTQHCVTLHEGDAADSTGALGRGVAGPRDVAHRSLVSRYRQTLGSELQYVLNSTIDRTRSNVRRPAVWRARMHAWRCKC